MEKQPKTNPTRNPAVTLIESAKKIVLLSLEEHSDLKEKVIRASREKTISALGNILGQDEKGTLQLANNKTRLTFSLPEKRMICYFNFVNDDSTRRLLKLSDYIDSSGIQLKGFKYGEDTISLKVWIPFELYAEDSEFKTDSIAEEIN